MCIKDLIEQFEIQGAYCIKVWDDDTESVVVLAEGKDFECERIYIREDYLCSEIIYMYAVDGVLNIEVEF